MGSVGASKGSGLSSLIEKAKAETNPNKVLYTVSDDKMGASFNSLSFADKSSIHGMLGLRKPDIEFFADNPTGTQTSSVRVGGVKYTITIANNNGKIIYSLNRGKKILVKQGSYVNVANQLALLLK